MTAAAEALSKRKADEPQNAEKIAPTYPKTIFQRICAIMQDVDAISKTRNNPGQNYKFRGIDDVYNDIHPLFVKNGVFSTSKILSDKSEERTTTKGGNLIYRMIGMAYTFHGEGGDSITTEVIGEGMDSGDKASNKAMAVAHKYAIVQLLSIPTEDPKDPEIDSPEPAPKAPPNRADNAATLEKTLAAPMPKAAVGFSPLDAKKTIEGLGKTCSITYDDLKLWVKESFKADLGAGKTPEAVFVDHEVEIKAYIRLFSSITK